MYEPNLVDAIERYSDEVRNLCSINERFDNEPIEVKSIRFSYANIFHTLTLKRDEAGRSEAGRNFSISITELENSCIRAVKGMYSK